MTYKAAGVVLGAGLLIAQVSAQTLLAQSIVEAVPKFPERLEALRFGMAVAEVQKAIPEAKPVIDVSEPRSVLAVFFQQPDVWDGAMLDLVNGRLEGINLVVGVNKTSDLLQRSQALLDELIARYGPGDTRTITLRSSTQPMPTRVWLKEDVMIFAVGPSHGISIAGKEVFGADPSFQVGIARRTRPLSEMAEIPSAAQVLEMLFRALSPGAVAPAR